MTGMTTMNTMTRGIAVYLMTAHPIKSFHPIMTVQSILTG